MSTINRAAANISSAVAYGPTGDTNPSGRSHFEWSPGIDRMKVIAQILKKLRRHGYWGGKHTAFDELPKGMPKHLRGDVKEAAEERLKKVCC